MLIRKYLVPVVVLGLATCMVTTLAQAADNGFYAGGQLGYAHTNYKSSDIPNNVLSATVDNNGIGFGGLVGYQFNPYAAVEIGYLDASGMKVSANDFPFDESLNMSMVDVMAKGMLPLGDKMNIYGKVGIASVHATSGYSVQFNNVQYPVSFTTEEVTETKPVVGLGFSYDITPHLPIDVSWLHVDKNGGKIPSADFFLVGVSYHFG